MEFWASEVKSGESFKVQPGEGMVLHLSQANLGEIKKEKGNESVCLFVNVDGKRLVLGTLSSEKLPQQQFDLVFDRDFELSHNWKGGSIYFFGYRAPNAIEETTEDDGPDFDSESEEDIPLSLENNGKPETKVKADKPADAKKPNLEKDSAAGKKDLAAGKKKVTTETGTGFFKGGDDDDDDDSSDDDSMPDDEDSDMDEDQDESDSEEEDESEEETPDKVEPGKKRPSDSELATPAANKKAKAITPQKTVGKKGAVHVATPHPSKQAGKTPANQTQKTPKSSGGAHVCKSCNRTFGSENGLESHTKAKHSAGK